MNCPICEKDLTLNHSDDGDTTIWRCQHDHYVLNIWQVHGDPTIVKRIDAVDGELFKDVTENAGDLFDYHESLKEAKKRWLKQTNRDIYSNWEPQWVS